MKLGAFTFEDAQGLDADPEMLADRAFVEGVGLAGQLDLAVERLVRDAEQGPVRYPEPITLSGDGGRLHVDPDGSGLVEAPGRQGEAKLPVAVVRGDDGAGAKPPLERLR